MPKFFVSKDQIRDEIVDIIGEDVNHIVNVLRIKKNDKIMVCNKDLRVTYNAEVISVDQKKVTCKIIEVVKQTSESMVDVTIFQGLPKSDKMEYIVQKSTELGVKAIVPIQIKRCIVKIQPKDETKKIARWQKIAESAAKQSQRDIIPKIENVIDISKLKELVPKFDLFLVAYEGESSNTLKMELSKMNKGNALKIGVIIGPEGGLDSNEVKELKEVGAKVITLGKRILRTETAPIVFLSNILYEFDY